MAKANSKKSPAKAKPAKAKPAKAKPAKAKPAKAKPAKAKPATAKLAKAKPAKAKPAKAKPATAKLAKAKPAKAKPAKAKPAKTMLAKAKSGAGQAKNSVTPAPTKGLKSVFKVLKSFVTPKTAISSAAKEKTPAPKIKAAPIAAQTKGMPADKATIKIAADVYANKSKDTQSVGGGVSAPKTPVKALLTLIAIPIPDEIKNLSPRSPVVDLSEETVVRETHQNDLFTQVEMAAFLATLLAERESLLNKARAAVEGGNIALDKDEMYDEVDLASATVDQNLTFRLLDRDRKLLGEIDHAIHKIETGEFGYCEGTYEPIPKRRLELRPWCRHSVKYKEQLEKLEKSGRGLVDEDAELLD
jgi:DnaK suppressor protein